MPIKRMKFISRAFVKEHPEWCFVFGDNEMRQGFGGQAAAMRGEPNSIGVATKVSPGTNEGAYWSDNHFLDHVIQLCSDFQMVQDELDLETVVVIPSDGLGTGLSELPKRATKPPAKRPLISIKS